jgi:hypothetical protein
MGNMDDMPGYGRLLLDVALPSAPLCKDYDGYQA